MKGFIQELFEHSIDDPLLYEAYCFNGPDWLKQYHPRLFDSLVQKWKTDIDSFKGSEEFQDEIVRPVQSIETWELFGGRRPIPSKTCTQCQCLMEGVSIQQQPSSSTDDPEVFPVTEEFEQLIVGPPVKPIKLWNLCTPPEKIRQLCRSFVVRLSKQPSTTYNNIVRLITLFSEIAKRIAYILYELGQRFHCLLLEASMVYFEAYMQRQIRLHKKDFPFLGDDDDHHYLAAEDTRSEEEIIADRQAGYERIISRKKRLIEKYTGFTNVKYLNFPD